mgnify:CR=1 FL=1
MTLQKRCERIKRLADLAEAETDPRRLRQLFAEIYGLAADVVFRL